MLASPTHERERGRQREDRDNQQRDEEMKGEGKKLGEETAAHKDSDTHDVEEAGDEQKHYFQDRGHPWYEGYRDETKRELLMLLSDDTTCHGLKRIFQHASYVRIFTWTLLFLASLGAFVWTTVLQFEAYYSYSLSTSVSIVSSNAEAFPDVVLCNLNPYSKYSIPYSRWSTPAVDAKATNSTLDAVTIDEWAEVIANLYAYPPSIEEADDLCFAPWDMLSSCQIYMGETNDPIDCGFRSVTVIPSKAYCHCFRFSGSNVSITRTGSFQYSDYMIMAVTVNQDAYIPTLSSSAGVRILVEPASDNIPVEEVGDTLYPANEIWMALQRQVVNRLTPPFGSCADSPYPLGGLTKVECKYALLQEFIISSCNCKDPYYMTTLEYYDPSTWDNTTTPHCYTQSDWSCAINATDAFLSHPALTDACHSKCSEQSYNYRLSYAQYPPPSSADLMREELISYLIADFPGTTAANYSYITNSYITNNYLQINIYFEELDYSEYDEQAAMDAVQLISNLGGNAGIFLGFSLMTFVEFLEYLAVLFAWWCHRCLRSSSYNVSLDAEPLAAEKKPRLSERAPCSKLEITHISSV